MKKMRKAYQQLSEQAGFKKLSGQSKILATWDDHDYGENDGGREFSFKDKSQQIFLDFLKLDSSDPRRKQKGVYSSDFFDADGLSVHIILLDTRYYRTKLLKDKNAHLIANYESSAELLGVEQWRWLTEQLKIKSDIKIIGSSIQFLSEQHRFEKWSNFPYERSKMLELIKQNSTAPVIILSGDRHHGEISTSEVRGLNYPLYDITSSGLTNSVTDLTIEETNVYRLENSPAIMSKHYTIMKLKKVENHVEVNLEFKQDKNSTILSHNFSLPLTKEKAY